MRVIVMSSLAVATAALLESTSGFSVLMGAHKPSAADAMALKIGLQLVPKKAAPAPAREGNMRKPKQQLKGLPIISWSPAMDHFFWGNPLMKQHIVPNDQSFPLIHLRDVMTTTTTTTPPGVSIRSLMHQTNSSAEELEQHELIQGTVHTLRRSLVSQLQSGPLVNAILEQLPTELSSCDDHVYEDGSIVSYRSGDFYDEHHDSYTPGEPLRQKQRAYTILLYMVSPPGPPRVGGTEFTQLTNGGHNQPLVVKPRAGDALVWPNFDRQGLPYMDSLHRALPVESNNGGRVEKVVINMWFQGVDNALQDSS
jgi:hypothetical protein